jgi:hypothetical protein
MRDKSAAEKQEGARIAEALRERDAQDTLIRSSRLLTEARETQERLEQENEELKWKLRKEQLFIYDRICIHHNDAERDAITCPVCLRAAIARKDEALKQIVTKVNLHTTFICAQGGDFNPNCAVCIAKRALETL